MGEQLTLEHEALQEYVTAREVMGATAIETTFAELRSPDQPALFWGDANEVQKYVFQIPGQASLEIEEV